METFDGPLHRHRGALIALAPLAALLLVVVALAPWRSNFDVDSMTHFEQARSVADHGSIGFSNGPVEQFPELRPRWFVARDGLAWGILPATESYLLAPAAKLGGYRGVIRALWLLLGLSAWATASVVHALTRRPYLAAASAWALVVGTASGFWATMVAPFVPAGCLAALAVAAGRRSVSATHDKDVAIWASLMGLCASAALGCHLLLAIPWGLLGLLTLGYGSARHRVVRAASYGLASLPSLGLMSWVNHRRFGAWSPISYGPCNAHTCTGVENTQTVHGFLEPLEPYRWWVLAWLASLWCARRSPRALALVAGVGVAAATVPDTPARDVLSRYPRALWGFVVDFGALQSNFPRVVAEGAAYGAGWAVRSLVQCSPWVVAAVFAARREGRSRDEADHATLAMLSAVALGVLAACGLRAHEGGAYVWGWPFLNPRYLVPALPAMTALAAAGVASLPLRAWHAGVAVAWAAYFGARLSELGETDPYKHTVTLRWPLYAATALFASLALARTGPWRRVAGAVAALSLAACVGMAGAEVIGVDRVAARDYRGRQDERVREVERCIGSSPRVLLVGGYALDDALVIRDARDVLFVNAGMGPRDGRGVRELLERFESPDRPAYILQEEPHEDRWQFRWRAWGMEEREGCPRVWRLVRRDPGP